MTATVRRPLFARAYDRISPLMEREVGALCDELLAGPSPHPPRADRRRPKRLGSSISSRLRHDATGRVQDARTGV